MRGGVINDNQGVAGITVYSEISVNEGDIFTFDQSWFFLEHVQYGRIYPKYKVQILSGSLVFKEEG